MFSIFPHGGPNATTDPPTRSSLGKPSILPVGTKSIPSPTYGPTSPIGAFTLNSHSFFPVSLSNAKITPAFCVFMPCAVDDVFAFSVNGI